MRGLAGALADTLVVVLAGGQGERLHPLTRDRAKPAVPFGGAFRILDFTLSNCLNSGLRRIYVLTQYKSLSLDRHVRDSWGFLSGAIGEFITPLPPQMRLGGSWYRGTADAIFQNIYTLEQERPRYVVVLSGDHVYRMDYSRMLAEHRAREAELTVGCIEVDRSEGRHLGIAGVDADGRITRWQEKPAEPEPVPGRPDRVYASMGIYVFDTGALVRQVSRDARRESDHDFGRNVIPEMIGAGRVFAHTFTGVGEDTVPYWRDIGRLDAYHDAHLDLLGAAPKFELDDPRWPIRAAAAPSAPVRAVDGTDGRPSEIRESLLSGGAAVAGARVVRSVAGRGVRIEEGAEVFESILFDGVVVGRGARLSRVVVDKGNRIPAGAAIGGDRERDAARFTVTERGVVVIPKEHRFGGEA